MEYRPDFLLLKSDGPEEICTEQQERISTIECHFVPYRFFEEVKSLSLSSFFFSFFVIAISDLFLQKLNFIFEEK